MIGQTFSHYKITAKLGQGGMGEVYLATDTNLDRQVAIKFLSADRSSDPEARQRFIHEAKAQAMLSHPNIATFLDVGEEKGRAFLVMEYVDGQPLPSLALDGKLSLPEILDLVIQVGEGLQAAHEHGVVHRDIKPENVLVTTKRQVKITDFGLARWKGATTLTKDGTRMGTAYYMSPEQAEGKRVDHRSDIFSLGVILYELVCHQRPFEGQNEPSILYEVLNTQPQPLARYCRDVPGELQRIVGKCLAKKPEERYQSVADLVADLMTVRKTLTSAVGQTLQPGMRTAPSIAVLPFSNLSADREQDYFCDGIAEEIINALTQVEGLRVVARTSAFAFKGKSEDLRLIGERLNVSTVLEGSVRRAGDRLRITAQLVSVSDGYHLWSERYDRDLTDVFAIQDDIATSIAAKFKMQPTEEKGVAVKRGTENLEAYEIFLKGRALQWKRGPSVRQAFSCFERAVALDPGYGEALAWMADSIRLSGLFGLAAPELTMPRAKDIAERALTMDAGLDEAYATLADVALVYDHDEAAAFRYWERALSLNPGHVRARCERAFWGLACVRGATGDALAEADVATESDPLSSYVASMRALILGVAGNYDDALRWAHRSCELDPEAFLANWGLVQACSRIGDHAGAIAAASKALAISGRHPWVLGVLASAYGLADQQDAADAILAELRARARLEYVQPTWIALAAIGAGKLEEAMALAEKGVDERDPTMLTAWRNPSWAPLRAHPRFGDLRQRMGFA